MKKIISILIVMMLSLSIIACGGSGRADDALSGKYIAVTGTSFGTTLSGSEMEGFTLELKSKGKATITIDDETINGKWVNDDDTVTITVEKTDIVGELGEDTIIFKDFLKEEVGVSLDITFAKEGTDAAKPENFLPEEEKALLGDWVGASVTDVMGDDASSEVSPSAITSTLNPDHSSIISFDGTEIATPQWSYISETVLFEGDVADGASLYGEYKDDQFIITYTGNDFYYNFTMESAAK